MLKKARAQAKAETGTSGGRAEDGAKDFAQGILASSRQIWLAGLGAFSRAQAEGGKLFETLVSQGQSLESRTRQAASDTASVAAGIAAKKAKEVHAMAGGTWDKLEGIFEERVARALAKLGVHSKEDVNGLAERVDALAEAVNELIKSQGRAPARPRKAAAKKKAARKTASEASAAPRRKRSA